MSAIRGIVIGLVAVTLTVMATSCQTASANESLQVVGNQLSVSVPNTPTLTTPTPTPTQSDNVVWGRVPYCNCFAESATEKVAIALKDAHLTVSLQELSPRDGWLYFAVTFDPLSASLEQVGSAMKMGGAEVLDAPP